MVPANFLFYTAFFLISLSGRFFPAISLRLIILIGRINHLATVGITGATAIGAYIKGFPGVPHIAAAGALIPFFRIVRHIGIFSSHNPASSAVFFPPIIPQACTVNALELYKTRAVF